MPFWFKQTLGKLPSSYSSGTELLLYRLTVGWHARSGAKLNDTLGPCADNGWRFVCWSTFGFRSSLQLTDAYRSRRPPHRQALAGVPLNTIAGDGSAVWTGVLISAAGTHRPYNKPHLPDPLGQRRATTPLHFAPDVDDGISG